MDRRRWGLALLAVGGCALAIHVACLFELRLAPPFSVLLGDSFEYDRWAREIAGGQWIGTGVFYQTPLYPYLLGIFFAVAGHHLFLVRLGQACLAALSCVLLAMAGRRFFTARVGLIAAALLAIYPAALFYDGLIQKSSLDLFLVTLLLVFVATAQRRTERRWIVAIGATIGFFALNREIAAVLWPIAAGWLLWDRRFALRDRATRALALTAATVLVLLPVGIRNYAVGGEFVLTTSQLGPNFYIGNHTGAGGGYDALVPGRGAVAFEQADARALAEQHTGRTLSASEVSAFWMKRSLDDIATRPGTWLALIGRKLLMTLNANELVDTESVPEYAMYSRVLRVSSWISFGVLLPFGALGVWATRRHRRLRILYWMFSGMVGAVALFFVVARYRYPLVPIVALFAGAGVAAIIDLVRRRHLPPARTALAGAIVFSIAGVLAHLPVTSNYIDQGYLNLGTALSAGGRPEDAIPLLVKAIEQMPSDPEPHYHLGVALLRSGQPDKAREELAVAVQGEPASIDAQAALAESLLSSGSSVEALPHFKEVVRLKPDDFRYRVNYGDALLAVGDNAEAIEQFRKAELVAPESPEIAANIGNLLALAYARNGQTADAIVEFKKSLADASKAGLDDLVEQIERAIRTLEQGLK